MQGLQARGYNYWSLRPSISPVSISYFKSKSNANLVLDLGPDELDLCLELSQRPLNRCIFGMRDWFGTTTSQSFLQWAWPGRDFQSVVDCIRKECWRLICYSSGKLVSKPNYCLSYKQSEIRKTRNARAGGILHTYVLGGWLRGPRLTSWPLVINANMMIS